MDWIEVQEQRKYQKSIYLLQVSMAAYGCVSSAVNQEQRTKLKPRKKDLPDWFGLVLDLIRYLLLRVYIYVRNKVFEQFWYAVYDSYNNIIFQIPKFFPAGLIVLMSKVIVISLPNWVIQGGLS